MVAAADVTSERSNAGMFDEERGGDYRSEGIGQGLASAILLSSFGGQGQRSGFSAKDLKVACSRHGLNWSYTDGALLELENRCFYLHTAAAGSLGKRYWFGTKPTLNKLVVQYRQQNASENFNQEIIEALRAQTQKASSGEATWRILVDPESDLPEQRALTLLILPPSLSWADDESSKDAVRKRVLELSSRCGDRDRHFRNTLLFLAPMSRGLAKARQAYRERAALEGVRKDYGEQLDNSQSEELKKRIDAAEKAALESLGPAYTVFLRVEKQEVEAYPLSDARPNLQDHLSYAWTSLIEDAEWILRKVGSVTLKNTGLTPSEGGTAVKDAVEAFLRFTDKPMIASKDAVTSGLSQACKDGVIGIGRGPNLSDLQARYCRREIPLDPSGRGLWIIPPFEPEAEKGSTGGRDETTTTDEGGGVTAGGEIGGRPEVKRGGVKRFTVSGAVPVENYQELFRCFISPAVRMNLKKLHLGFQFEMEVAGDQQLDVNDPSLKAMKEAARQLGLKFEVED